MLLKLVRSLAESTSSINHIINDNAIAVINAAHQIHTLNLTRLTTLLDDHGHTGVNVVLGHHTITELLHTVDTTSIGGHNHRLVKLHLGEIVHTDHTSLEVIHGDARAKETLDLTAVEIHGNHTIHSHSLEETSDISGRDGDTSGHLAILTSVTVVGNHSGDAASAGSAGGTDEKHQLHQVVVDVGRAGRLNDEQVLSANILVDIHHNLTIGKATNLHVSPVLHNLSIYPSITYSAGSKLGAELLDNLLSQGAVGVSREHTEVALKGVYMGKRGSGFGHTLLHLSSRGGLVCY